jgi:type VI secretion system protein ImpD/type VI secretion system protein ImpC
VDPVAADQPLREAVLAGRLFGAAAQNNRTSLADFLLDRPADAVRRWFGDLPKAGLREAIDRDIAAIDDLLSAQIDAILHHPRYQRMEARWRALRWLTDRAHEGRWREVRFRALNITWTEIARDVTRATEFDQSELFRKIYEEEFGRAGGEPFGLMVVDHEVSHGITPGASADDVTVLEQLRGIAAAAFSPMIFGAAPPLIGLDSFVELQRLPDLEAVFRDRHHARWNALMGRRDTEFLAVTLPRVLIRPPWRDDDRHPIPFRYNERVPTPTERCWATAGFAFAAVVARAFAEYGWPADVRGSDPDREGGGIVTGLPIEWFHTDPVGVWPRLPIEIVLSDAQERHLVEAGLMPVSAPTYGTELLFGVVRSLRRPERYTGANAAAAEASARLSSQVNSVLCASRFAHHLKMMAREMLGSAVTANEIERRLATWLMTYVNGSQSDDPELRARYPLIDGRVEVRDIPGMPGAFSCNLHLQPHFQLDDVGATFSLVTEVTPLTT